MGERKVLNKYYPPDFDPARLKKPKMPSDRQIKTRMMLPFTCKCSVCGTYLHIGTKFNMRKEVLTDETYLGIEIIRFFFKCTRCTTEITMKSDPKNHDYICESNATRQYEEKRDLEAAANALNNLKKQEGQDPMKYLEARTMESRREMAIQDALGNILEINKIQERVDFDGVMKKILTNRNLAEFERAKSELSQIENDDLKSGFVKRIDEDSQSFRKSSKEESELGKRQALFRKKPKFVVKKVPLD
jgi:hypothetical protein